MQSTHTATAALAFQLATMPMTDAPTEVRALCDRLGIHCNSELLEALTQPDLGQRVEELLLQAANGLLECEPWGS